MSLVDRQFDLLKKELELIDAAIRQIDDMTKGIKKWAIVTWTASVGVALTNTELCPYLWLTGSIPLLFWVVDGSYRRDQRSFILRQREIAEFVNSDSFTTSVSDELPLKFSFLKMRVRSVYWRNQMLGVMLFRTVAILYLGLGALSLLVWLVSR